MFRRTLPLFLALPACASQLVNAPSLLPRAIETRGDALANPRSETVAPDPALEARIAERRAAFDTAARAFDTARPALARRIAAARGGREGSEGWLDGQQAVGELQQLRTATDAAMADLEALAIERGGAGLLPYPALEAAIAAAQAVLDRQIATETDLREKL